MVDIISRKDGPRREDAAAKRMIDANRATITHLADRLTQGGYSAGIAAKKAAAAPRAAEPVMPMSSPVDAATGEPHMLRRGRITGGKSATLHIHQNAPPINGPGRRYRRSG